MALDACGPDERVALVDVLAELMNEDRESLAKRDSIWRSFQNFEAKGALSIQLDAEHMVLRLKDDPDPLTLPRGAEFVRVCNNRFGEERSRLDAMVKALFSPPRPQRPVADVVPLRPKQTS